MRDDRNRPGGRRTSAQPLRASYRPQAARRPARKPGRRKGLRGLLATYGWRVYALPVLIAVTAFVVVDTAGQDGSGASADQPPPDQPGTSRTTGPSQPITERPVDPVNVNIPTAKLPKGGSYTKAGAGEWKVLPGSGQRVGDGGPLYTYTVEVEKGIDPASYGGNDTFAALVDQTLADPRGWAETGQVSVQRVDGSQEPDIRMSLTTPRTVHRPDICGYAIKYESSCRNGQRVVINLARWVRGALAFNGDIGSYRQYAINHEIGHAFERGHVGCAEDGELAPVMMQQTFGVSNDFVAKLNNAVGNTDPVEADGKTCTANPWPNPQAKP